MATSQMTYRVVTPAGALVEGEATSVRLVTRMGEIEVLPDHDALIAALDIGGATITTSSGPERYALSRGYIEVLDNDVTVVAESAERAAEIDAERARKSLEEATAALSTIDAGAEPERYARALARQRRSEVRLEVAKGA